jgi:metal-sulfur cluster biosynthetic enzyme
MKLITNDDEKCAHAIVALYDVYDPEIGLNIIDLGLVYQIGFDERTKQVETEMTLTSQYCPMGESITADVTQALTNTFPGYEIKVNLTFDPPWSPDFITPEGRKFLDS